MVFDFDRTIIDGDSDNWVVVEMGLAELFNQLLYTMPWNSLMNRMMMELYSEGKTEEDIANCLKRCPLHPQIFAAIKSAQAHGCDLRIASDSNSFFIESILKHHGLLDCFSEITTNPSFVDEEGRLKILPYHDVTSSPHGCNLCPPNMCKGLVIERIVAAIAERERKRIIYIGDGRNDFCPSLKLRESDYLMPRKNFPLWNRICEIAMLIKAEVHEWSSAEEFKSNLLCLIDKIFIEEESDAGSISSQLKSSECNLATMCIQTHETLSPQTLQKASPFLAYGEEREKIER